ncbi:MAG: alkaline phosphatase family protein [Balneolaceae bacterium]
MSVFFLFIDGIGIGENSADNPLASSWLKSFSSFTSSNGFHEECNEVITDTLLFKKVDANFGVEGLPQSGTGQAALFSGKNTSELLGRHFGPYPHSKIKPVLKTNSLFHQVQQLGLKPHFMNAYPDIFFKKAEKRNRWSCTTLMAKSAGIPLNRLEDVMEERALTAEIIQSVWREHLQLDVPEIKPEDASIRILKAMERYDLVMFEYYLTDKAGHGMERDKADWVLRIVDRFLLYVMNNIKKEDTLVVCSDHGNLEDLSIKTHTRNRVPLFVKGKTEYFKNAESILDVTPAIISLLASEVR